MLSKVGKEILINVVAKKKSIYTRSCFKLLNALFDDLTSMVRNFWWDQKTNEHKRHGLAGISHGF